MAAGTGKSGREVAEEHVQALAAVLSGYANKPLPRYNGELNRSRLAVVGQFKKLYDEFLHEINVLLDPKIPF